MAFASAVSPPHFSATIAIHFKYLPLHYSQRCGPIAENCSYSLGRVDEEFRGVRYGLPDVVRRAGCATE